MYIAIRDSKHFIEDYYDYFLNGLKIGLIVAIQSGTYIKSGMGKSYLAMKIGEKIDKNFNIDKVVFTPSDFVDAMDEIETINKPHQVISIDEAGILVNSKKWYSFINKSIGDCVMTFRNLRSMAIFCTPETMILDKFIRWYVSHLFTVRKTVVSSRKVTVFAKNFTLAWKEDAKKYYRHKIKIYDRAIQRVAIIEKFKVNLPKEELYKQYEERVLPYKKKIRLEIKNMEKDTRSFQWYIDDFFLNKKHLIKTSKQYGFKSHVFADDVKESYGLTHRKAQTISRLINEKLDEQGRENGESV